MYINESIQRLQKTLAFFEEKFPAGFDKYWDAGSIHGQPGRGELLIIQLTPAIDTVVHEWVRPAFDKTGFSVDITRMNTESDLICYVGPNSVLALVMYFQQIYRSEPHHRYLTMLQAFDIVARLIKPLREFTRMAPLNSKGQLMDAQVAYADYGDDTIVLMDILMKAVKRTLGSIQPSATKCPGLKEMQDIVQNYGPLVVQEDKQL